jgi:hypothetical protein
MKSNPSMSSAAATPASPSQSPASSEGTRTNGISGPTSRTPFAFYDLSTRSWRTSQATFDLGLSKSSLILPKSGSMRDGALYEHPMSELPIGESVCSFLLPTPANQEPGWKHIEVVDRHGNPPEHGSQRFYDKETGRLVQKGLQQIVTMLPTPTGDDANNVTRASGEFQSLSRSMQELLPTPTSQDAKHGGGSPSQHKRNTKPLGALAGDLMSQQSEGGSE